MYSTLLRVVAIFMLIMYIPSHDKMLFMGACLVMIASEIATLSNSIKENANAIIGMNFAMNNPKIFEKFLEEKE